jgi:hypothetical protein
LESIEISQCLPSGLGVRFPKFLGTDFPEAETFVDNIGLFCQVLSKKVEESIVLGISIALFSRAVSVDSLLPSRASSINRGLIASFS